MTPRSFAAALLVLLVSSQVDAFPGGAGGCEGGMAAVGGFHLDTSNNRPVVPGTLSDGAIAVTVGGTTLNANTTVDLPVGQDLPIAVLAEDIPYLGVLVRLQAPSGVDTTGALVPGANTQIAAVCAAPVQGITHTNNSQKTMAMGMIRFDEQVLGATLDVTVVFINGDAGSAFVYTGFQVNFRAADVPTSAPAAAPVAAPVVAPVPVAPPVTAPMAAPVAAPVAPPVTAPVSPPVIAPVKPPTDSPTPLPTTETMLPTSFAIETPSPTTAFTDMPNSISTPHPTIGRRMGMMGGMMGGGMMGGGMKSKMAVKMGMKGMQMGRPAPGKAGVRMSHGPLKITLVATHPYDGMRIRRNNGGN